MLVFTKNYSGIIYKSTFVRIARNQASNIDGISIKDTTGKYKFSGSKILCLEQWDRQSPILENISVYGNIYERKYQPECVLRQTLLSMKKVSNQYFSMPKDQIEECKVTLPAKFIQLPIEYVERWIAQFSEMDITLSKLSGYRTANILRGLYIAHTYNTDMLHFKWNYYPTAKRQKRVNKEWDKVWKEMHEICQVQSTNIDGEVRESSYDMDQKMRYEYEIS